MDVLPVIDTTGLKWVSLAAETHKPNASRVGLTTYLVEQEPHVQPALFTDEHKSCRGEEDAMSEISVLELPVPWLYYLIEYWPGKRYHQMRVRNLLCRHTPVEDLKKGRNEYNCVPLPNTGAGGYTCSHSQFLPNEVTNVSQQLALCIGRFWEENFAYYEQISTAHIALHNEAGVLRCQQDESVQIEAYRFWEVLKPEELATKAWLSTVTATSRWNKRLDCFLLSDSLTDHVRGYDDDDDDYDDYDDYEDDDDY